MRKQLPTDGIANELAGSSVFFQPAKDEAAQPLPAVETIYEPIPERLVVATPETKLPSRDDAAPTDSQGSVVSRHRDTTTSDNQEASASTKSESKPESKPESDDTAAPAIMPVEVQEELRKAVKQLGKEAATHRFTPDEKRAIADIVYTYSRQGVRTSENEITRIAVNWLLLDYHRRGQLSVLSKLLESLHG